MHDFLKAMSKTNAKYPVGAHIAVEMFWRGSLALDDFEGPGCLLYNLGYFLLMSSIQLCF